MLETVAMRGTRQFPLVGLDIRRIMDVGLVKGVHTSIEFAYISPHNAERLLSLNEVNRSLNDNKVTQILSDIKDDLFTFVGDPIRVFFVAEAEQFYLLDGQHRLWAIFQQGQSVPIEIVWMEGTRKQMIRAMQVIDKGAARSLGQDIQISRKMGDDTYDESLPNRSLTLAINALFYADKVIVEKGTRSIKRISVPTKEAYATAHVGEVTFLSDAVGTYRKANHTDPATGWLAGLLLAYRLSPKRAARFWKAVSVGVDHPLIFTQSPAFLLHDLMQRPLNIIMAKEASGTRVTKSAGIFIKMWNAHVAGRAVKTWRMDDTFPTPLPHPDEDVPFDPEER